MEYTATWNSIYKIEHQLKCSDNFNVLAIYEKKFNEFVFMGRIKTQSTSGRKIIDQWIKQESDRISQEDRIRIRQSAAILYSGYHLD